MSKPDFWDQLTEMRAWVMSCNTCGAIAYTAEGTFSLDDASLAERRDVVPLTFKLDGCDHNAEMTIWDITGVPEFLALFLGGW